MKQQGSFYKVEGFLLQILNDSGIPTIKKSISEITHNLVPPIIFLYNVI